MTMKICISPAKGFKRAESQVVTDPVLREKSEALIKVLQSYTEADLKNLFKVSDKIAAENRERFKAFSFDKDVLPAVEIFDGMAYKALDMPSLPKTSKDYIRMHVAIFSGLYGYLRSYDGIRPYRLDLKDKVKIEKYRNLYDYWGKEIYTALKKDADGLIINLASREYFQAVSPYIEYETVVTCTFLVMKEGKRKNMSPWAKKGRGLMVRYMAKKGVTDYRDLKDFHEEGFRYAEENISDDKRQVEYIFVRTEE